MNMGQMQRQTPYTTPDVKESASRMVDQTKDMLSAQLTSRTQQSAGQIDDVARALRETGKQLGESPIGPYVEKAADQLQRASQYVRTADLDGMKRTVETFARREPLLFIGGAFALGMLGARFIKSSARHLAAQTEQQP
jgi:hypothetical protein